MTLISLVRIVNTTSASARLAKRDEYASGVDITPCVLENFSSKKKLVISMF